MSMKTIKVAETTDTQLDWLVAQLVDPTWVWQDREGIYRESTDDPVDPRFQPTCNWSQMGPIIEREKIDCIADPNGRDVWKGRLYRNKAEYYRYGATALIAAARCYVASKLGETVEVPEELT